MLYAIDAQCLKMQYYHQITFLNEAVFAIYQSRMHHIYELKNVWNPFLGQRPKTNFLKTIMHPSKFAYKINPSLLSFPFF